MRPLYQRESKHPSLASREVFEQVSLELLLYLPDGKSLSPLGDQSVDATQQVALADGAPLRLLQAGIKRDVLTGLPEDPGVQVFQEVSLGVVGEGVRGLQLDSQEVRLLRVLEAGDQRVQVGGPRVELVCQVVHTQRVETTFLEQVIVPVALRFHQCVRAHNYGVHGDHRVTQRGQLTHPERLIESLELHPLVLGRRIILRKLLRGLINYWLILLIELIVVSE